VLKEALDGYWHPLEIGVWVSETPKTWAIYREKW
jgi:hypothetical protein